MRLFQVQEAVVNDLSEITEMIDMLSTKFSHTAPIDANGLNTAAQDTMDLSGIFEGLVISISDATKNRIIQNGNANMAVLYTGQGTYPPCTCFYYL